MRPFSSFVSFFLTFFLLTSLYAGERYVYQVIMAGMPAGTVTDLWERLTVDGTCVVRVTSEMKINLPRGGAELAMGTRSIAEADCDTYLPRTLKVERDEGGSRVVTEARRVGKVLRFTTEKNGVSEKGEVPLEKDTVFFGMLFRRYPDTFFLRGGEVPALSEEGLAVRRIPFKGRREGAGIAVDVQYEGVPISFIVSKRVVRSTTMSGGLIVYRLQDDPTPPPLFAGPLASQQSDILTATALRNNGITIKRPRDARRLIVLIEKSADPIPTDCRQRVAESGQGQRAVTIDAGVAPCPGAPQAADTAANLYEDKDHPAIREAASRWRSLTDRALVVESAVRFVHDHIADKNYRHGTLSASETLALRAGDCTEHAVLAGALLKALGVPTRMVYGLVLADDGRFFFHNWIEVHTGAGWIAADPTFRQFPADAAHLAIARSAGTDATRREDLSLAVMRFLQQAQLSVTGVSYE